MNCRYVIFCVPFFCFCQPVATPETQDVVDSGAALDENGRPDIQETFSDAGFATASSESNLENQEPVINENGGEKQPSVGVRSWGHLPSRSQRGGVIDAARDVLISASADFSVPSELVYGIWNVESGRLDSGWSEDWHLAFGLPRYGSPCARRYGIIKCRNRWRAVQRICSQKTHDGELCDPNEVRSSFAIALGPMQHLATEWSPAEGEWGRHVVDYDNDGTFSPFELSDSMASAAKFLKLRHDECRATGLNGKNSWRHAVNLYLGVKEVRSSRYARKVYRYAKNWCAVSGYCETGEIF